MWCFLLARVAAAKSWSARGPSPCPRSDGKDRRAEERSATPRVTARRSANRLGIREVFFFPKILTATEVDALRGLDTIAGL